MKSSGFRLKPAHKSVLWHVQTLYVGFFIWTSLALTVTAATHYVATDGNDANTGSIAQPFRTIQKAARAAVAGDTVIVRPGNYLERVETVRDGSRGAPIRFIAEGSVTVGGFAVVHRWQEITGFRLNGTSVPGYSGLLHVTGNGSELVCRSNTLSTEIALQYLVRFTDGPTNVLLESNRILETPYMGVSIEGSGHILTNNYFSSTNGGDALRIFSSNTRISSNLFTNWSNLTGNLNHTDLIQAFSYNAATVATNVVIERNLFVDCLGTQIGNIEDQSGLNNVRDWTWRNNIWVNVEYKMSVYASDFAFYNNLFYRTGRNAGHPLMFRTSTDRGNAHNAKLINNLFVECGSDPSNPGYGWYLVTAGLTNVQADFNLVVGTSQGTAKTSFQASGREVKGINGLNPLFIQSSSLDFRLQAGSPCIGKAFSMEQTFRDDFLGTLRDQSWDIGPLEFRSDSSATTPRPPSNLSFVLR